MNKPVWVLLLSLVSVTSGAQKMAGDWQGLLIAGKQKLRIVFHIKTDSAGRYFSTFDSPDQNAFSIPCEETTVKADSIGLLIKPIGAGYRGKWDRKNNFTGHFFQGGAEYPTVLSRVEPPKRPQTPLPPYAYNTEDIEYDDPVTKIHYGGTLTSPKSGGPFPTAILITGSGRQDRDETILGHKPFAVIADFLTNRGYAVLRVDDRQTGKTTGEFAKATTLDFVGDVKAGLRELQKRKNIDRRKIGLIGHSEGGLIASMIASENPDISFIILLAGPGVKGYELMALQDEAYMLSLGLSPEMATADKKLKEGLMLAILSSQDSAVQISTAMKFFSGWASTSGSGIVTAMHLTDETSARQYISIYLKGMNTPWMLYLLQSDPVTYLSKVKGKVLALNGSKDLQVIANPNLRAIDSALKNGRSKGYSTQKLPGLNHLFQHCISCTIIEYGELEETFSPEAMEIMAGWLDKNVK